MDMRFGTWNVRSLYSTCSLKTVAREVGKYKLDLLGLQEVRWKKGGAEKAEDCTLFYGERNENYQLGTGFVLHNRILSAVRRVGFASYRMSYKY
jgi:exonuclease III